MNTARDKNPIHEFSTSKDFDAYVAKLKQLPPLEDKTTEERLRAFANAILDRIEDDDKSGRLEKGKDEQQDKN